MDVSVAGDDDRWMLLERASHGGRPIVVRTRINPDIQDFARENHITAVICDVDQHLVNEHGMPICMDALFDIEDRLIGLAKDSGKQAYHTASATGDARRTVYFAHSVDLSITDMVSFAPNDVCAIWTTDDFTHETYEEFISPTPLDVQINGDHSVIASLEQNGDDGATPRKIDFWFYGTRSSLEALATPLAAIGMVIDHWLDDDDTGIVMSMTAPATKEHFRDLTPAILEFSRSAGVKYDGWETLVLTPPSTKPDQRPPETLLTKLFGKTKFLKK